MTEGGLSKVASIDGIRTIGIGASSSYDDAAVLYLEGSKVHCTTIQNVTRTTHTHENTIQSRPFISAYTTTHQLGDTLCPQKKTRTDIECSSRACGVPCCALPSLRAQITYCPPAPVDSSCVRVHAPPSPTHHSLHTFLPEGEKKILWRLSAARLL